jgi:hypothetical protein
VAHYDENARESRNAALLGFLGALVWIAIVGGISFAWANASAKGGEHPAAAEAAQTHR